MATKKAKKAPRTAWADGEKRSKEFGALGGEGFAEAMKALLFSELEVAGLPLDDLVGFLAENKSDGGVDLFLNRAPPSPTEFIRRECVFQFKLSCPPGSKLKQEIKNASRALGLLRNGADYTLLAGADFPTEQYQPKLEAAIRSLIPKWRGQCRVWNAQSLLQECLRCSGTLPSFKVGLGSDVISWSQWQSEDRFSVAEYHWTPDPARRELIKAFHQEAATSQKVWRYVGQPGVGKSRFVLEVMASRGAHAIVAKKFTQFLRSQVESLRVGWLVVDECSSSDHDELVQLFRNTAVRLITIGQDRGHGRAPGVPLLLPMGDDEIGTLLPAASVDALSRSIIVGAAGGYPKLARLYVKALSASGRLIRHTEDLEQCLKQFLDGTKIPDTAFHLWALPTAATRSEVEAIASHRRFSVEASVVERAHAFLNRQGLIGSFMAGNEEFSYVTPLGFAEWLARYAWEAPESVLAALEDSAPRVRRACIRRLTDGTHEDLRKRLADLDLARVTTLISPGEVAELADALASQEPERALALIRRLVHLDLTGSERRKVASALRSIAWFPNTFTEAARLLFEHADETVSYMTVDLFGSWMGTTQATGAQRLEHLEWLGAQAPDLAVKCAIEACTIEHARGSGGLPASLREAWHPTSRAEDLAYVEGAVAALIHRAPGDEAFAKAAQRVIRPLFGRALGQAVQPLVNELVRRHMPIWVVSRELELVEKHDLRTLNAEDRKEHEALVRAITSGLPSLSLADRIVRIIHSESWFRVTADNAPSGALDLARELVAQASVVEPLRAIEDTRGGAGLFEFARLCARSDPGRVLVPSILELARELGALHFAVGYFFEWHRAELDPSLAKWAADLQLVRFTFSLIHRLGSSPERAKLLLQMVRSGSIPRARLSELYLGAWLTGVSDEDAMAILDEMPMPGRLLAAEQRFGAVSPQRRVPIELWFQVRANDLHDMVEHVWSQLAQEARRYDAARFSESLLRVLSDPSLHSTETVGPLLHDWLEEEPQAISSVLAAIHRTPLLSLGMRGFQLNEPTLTFALKWLKEQPGAILTVAHLSSGTDPLAVELLDTYGENTSVRSALMVAAHSYFGWGNRSDLVRAQSERLRALSQRAKAAHTKTWFREVIASLEREAEAAGDLETAYESGAIAHPYAADLND